MSNFAAAAIALVLAGMLLTALQFMSLRRQFAEALEALTRMTGINAAAALMFSDRDAATETLNTLDVVPGVQLAAIYAADGTLFVSHLRVGSVPARLAQSGLPQSGSKVELLRMTAVDTIVVDGNPVGTIVVGIGLRRLYMQLAIFAGMFALAGLVALGVSYPLVSRMRGQVTRAARRIREQASLLDKAQDAIVVRGLDRRIVYWNKSAERLYQWPSSKATGRSVEDLFDVDRDAFDRATRRVLDDGEWRGELTHRRKDGTSVPVECHWTLVRDEDGKPNSILAIETDISARKHAEAGVTRLSRMRAVHGGISSAILRVRERQELLYAACRVAVTDGVFAFAWTGVFDQETGDGAVAAWFGERPSYLQQIRHTTLAGLPYSERPGNRAAREMRLVVCNDVATDPSLEGIREAMVANGHRSIAACPLVVNGRTVAVLMLCAREVGFFDEDEVQLLEWLGADLSYALDHIEKARRLDYLAYYDALTGLPNSTLFRDRLGQFLHNAATPKNDVCMMLVDLERFTSINDTLGREVGDAVLRAVGQRLSDRLVDPFTVARIGADTFAIANVRPRERSATDLRDAVMTALAEPLHVRGREIRLTMHAGIALASTDSSEVETLFKNAEAALKEAKATSQRVLYYAAEMNARMAERVAVEEELRVAIAEAQFVLHYQPRVDLFSGNVVGSEALIRWQHPDGGLIGPDQFIRIAEQTGQIVAIGDWVVRTACRQQAAWLARGVIAVPVSVNLSATQLRRGDVLECVRSALAESSLEAKYLQLELTESAAMENPQEAERTLQALHDLGVQISLDDFGTGFSSLAYLKRFPLSAVKIDRTFISDITRSPDDAAIANAVIAMAHGMALRVVAEGVETEAQLRYLRARRCDEIQGFAFSPALDAERFEELLRSGRVMDVPGADKSTAGTLLIVDDESGIRAALNRVLRRDGYRILTAESGEQGLELLALHPIQVIISDQRMPGMSGAEFLDVVRQLYPATIRIILSGFTDLQVVTDSVNRGAVYKFLTKPWDDDLLRDQVRDAFRRYRPESE